MEKDKLNDSKIENVNGGFVEINELVLTRDDSYIKRSSLKQETEIETNLDNKKQ